MRITPDGTYLFTQDLEGNVKQWHIEQKKLYKNFGIVKDHGHLTDMGFDVFLAPDGNAIFPNRDSGFIEQRYIHKRPGYDPITVMHECPTYTMSV